MNDDDNTSINEAWRMAPDDHLRKALHSPEFYNDEVFQIVQQEATRRGITIRDASTSPQRNDFVRSGIKLIHKLSFIVRVIGASLIGLVYGLFTTLLRSNVFSGIGFLLHMVLLFVFFICLATCCIPLRKLRVIIIPAFAAALVYCFSSIIGDIYGTIPLKRSNVDLFQSK